MTPLPHLLVREGLADLLVSGLLLLQTVFQCASPLLTQASYFAMQTIGSDTTQSNVRL